MRTNREQRSSAAKMPVGQSCGRSVENMVRRLSEVLQTIGGYGFALILLPELRAAACTKIYAEKVSGAWSDRPQLAKLLKRLDQGDVLIVTRLDRLARSTRDLLNILDVVGKAGAGFQVPERRLGRHDDTARPPHAHGAWGTRRVRARANHRPHRRGPKPSEGPRREIRATGSSDAASTAGRPAGAWEVARGTEPRAGRRGVAGD